MEIRSIGDTQCHDSVMEETICNRQQLDEFLKNNQTLVHLLYRPFHLLRIARPYLPMVSQVKCFLVLSEPDFYLPGKVEGQCVYYLVDSILKKASVINDWPVPMTLTVLQAFLEMVGYYRQYV